MSTRASAYRWFTGLAVAFLFGGLITVAGTARSTANECRQGCNLDKRLCIQNGRVAKHVCKLECQESSAPGELRACRRGCKDTSRAVKDDCRGFHRDCRDICTGELLPLLLDPNNLSTPDPNNLPIPDPNHLTIPHPLSEDCLRSCGADLVACADPVIHVGWDCVRACREDPDRLGCLRLCATTAAADAVACFEDFKACLMATCPEP